MSILRPSQLSSGSYSISGSFSGSFEGDGSNITGLASEWDGSHLGDASITGSLTLSGSSIDLNVLGNISASAISSSTYYGDGSNLTGITATTSSYALTASYVETSQTSSYVETAQTASYVLNAISSSFSTFAISASYAVSASHEIIKEISSSYADTASFAQSGDGIFSGSFSGSYVGDGSGLTGIIHTSASYALTSSYVNPLTQDVTITGSLTVTGSSSSVNLQELQFDIQYSSSGHNTGRMYWDDTNKTATIDMQGSDVRLQVGQESHIYAKNTSGVTIPNGAAVKISGATGTNLNIELALSTVKSFKSVTEANEILGIATEEITNNKFGYITTFGSVGGLDTSAFTEGDILYLSNTTSGSYSNAKPPAPYFEARVGVVKVSNNGAGVIISRPQEPTFLTDIAQVTSSGVIPNEKTYLCYDDSTDLINFTNTFSGSFSGSFQGDGSGLTGILHTSASYASTASYVETAQTASYVLNAVSSSFSTNSITSSFAQSGNGIFSGSFSGSFEGDGSGLTGILHTSASYASTASYVETAQTASYVLNSISSSYSQTSSYTEISQTASYVETAQTASYVLNAVSSSFASTSSYSNTSSFAQSGDGIFSGSFSGSYIGDGSGLTGILHTTSSYALTASYVETSQTASYVLNSQTASYVETAQTASYVTTSSIDGITNYVRNDQTSSMTVLSSSYAISSSYSETTDFILGGNVFGPVVDAVNAISSSYAITSSYAETAQTSSYVLNAVSSSYALTASYAVSASHEIIKEISSSYADTASFAQSGNGIFSGSFSGSYIGDGSGLTNIPTPNAVVTASNATNDDTIEFLKGGGGTFSVTVNNIETSQTASYVLNAVSSSYALLVQVTLQQPPSLKLLKHHPMF
jgi:hypothetical protein